MVRILILTLVALSLTGCGKLGALGGKLTGKGSASRTRTEIDGVRFSGRATSDRGDKRSFAVTVSPVAVNPSAAMEVGRYQATRYCLLNFGGSDTEWVVGPETPADQLILDRDTLTLTGRCVHR